MDRVEVSSLRLRPCVRKHPRAGAGQRPVVGLGGTSHCGGDSQLPTREHLDITEDVLRCQKIVMKNEKGSQSQVSILGLPCLFEERCSWR